MPTHHNAPPVPSKGRETWSFTREEVIAVLRQHTGAQDGDFFLWGLEQHCEPYHRRPDGEIGELTVLTLVRDY